MNPSIIIGVAVVLVSVMLIGWLLYRRHKNSPDYFERTRSPRYDINMRDHRKGFIWTTAVALALAIIPLADWASFHFLREWPTATANIIDVSRTEFQRRIRYTNTYRTYYNATAHYSYTVNGQTYTDVITYTYDDAASRDQRAANLMSEVFTVWYHPIISRIHFGNSVGPIYDIAILWVAGFVGIGSLSSLWGMIRLRLTDGY